MKQFQVVIARLSGTSRNDEESLTDLINERERTGWHLESTTTLEPTKVMLVFAREA